MFTIKRFVLLIPIMIFIVFVAAAQDEGDDVNEFGMTEAEMVARGEYLAHIGACVACHTPQKEEYLSDELSVEQLQTIAWSFEETQDIENQLLAGGRQFPLGPYGVLVSPNLTSDATGLGDWTDEEIEAAIRIGINRDGRRLYPLMPYPNFYNWAEADMQALIMYLRTVPPVENEVIQTGPSGEGVAPELVVNAQELPQLPPDTSDQEALGRYLVSYVMSCGDCHTPLDPETGVPLIPDMLLAGGQAYEGPWGIVYGSNITPHETGLADWEAEDYIRVFREGVRIDGRRVVFMPWQDYTSITDEDLDAVIAYLQSIEPVDNEIPAPALEDIFIEFVDDEE